MFCLQRLWGLALGSDGAVAEWLCSGLQIRLCRFDSGPCLQYPKEKLPGVL